MASGPGPNRRWGLGGQGFRGRGQASVWPGPGHVRVRTPLSPPASHPGPPRTMGSILSRRIAGVEDIDIQANSAYRYPPKSGERPAPTPGADGEARAGRRVGRARPSRPGASAQEWVGGSARPASPPPPHCPELCAPSTWTPGHAWDPGVTVSSRLGDLGSVTSPLSAPASSSAHWGDPRETPRAAVRCAELRWRRVRPVPGASPVLTEWSLSQGLTSHHRRF